MKVKIERPSDAFFMLFLGIAVATVVAGTITFGLMVFWVIPFGPPPTFLYVMLAAVYCSGAACIISLFLER